MSSSQTVRMSVRAASERGDRFHRGQAAAGEDQAVREARRRPSRPRRRGRRCRSPAGRTARRAPAAPSSGRSRVEVLPADRLDHLDRDEAVVSARRARGSPAEHAHAVVEPGALDPRLGVGALLGARSSSSSPGSRSREAACTASPPQPVPISSRCVSGPSSSARQMRSSFARWASSSASSRALEERATSRSSRRGRGRARRGRCRGRSGPRCCGARRQRVLPKAAGRRRRSGRPMRRTSRRGSVGAPDARGRRSAAGATRSAVSHRPSA